MTADARGVEPLVIVGAGFAGLAAAHVARELGVDALVLDRHHAPGGAWRDMPADMECLSPRERDRLPDGTHPVGPGQRASAGEVLACLTAFAARHRPRMELGRSVRAVHRRGDGALELDTDRGPLVTRALLVASGEHGRPRDPALPGVGFGGPIEHSSRLDRGVVAPGERVAVIGAGNSGAEVALDLATRGARVTVFARHPPRVSADPSEWPVVGRMTWWLSGLPVRSGPLAMPCESRVPLKRPPFVAACRDGSIAIESAATELAPTALRSARGAWVEVDRVVLATGFHRDTAWLGPAIVTDADGHPAQRRGASIAVPGVAFVGLPCMRTRRSGFLRGFTEDARRVVPALLAGTA